LLGEAYEDRRRIRARIIRPAKRKKWGAHGGHRAKVLLNAIGKPNFGLARLGFLGAPCEVLSAYTTVTTGSSRGKCILRSHIRLLSFLQSYTLSFFSVFVSKVSETGRQKVPKRIAPSRRRKLHTPRSMFSPRSPCPLCSP